ncbi:5-deoxy-glucuronate isomerase [Nakamurella panacisegetis]|uniref:5-deoxy-glucuronate isomerase n=1 Tax=Nakamurella panacisegetis TaxID=1090615 RepID=A0A1H0IL47_9ACTN|nr:5-deoxy-glucuronate isomerase [Nakamurella panacisegetis]SDO32075.1 5-deoxy-glucuronate isomerase [Nakamurella panacisegetis]
MTAGHSRRIGRPGRLYRPAGSTGDDVFDLVVTPESAGWGYSSLRVLTLGPGGAVTFPTGDAEMLALPLSGGCSVTVDGVKLQLQGRPDVFTAVTDFAYLPMDSRVTVVSDAGVQIAFPGARASRRLPFRYGPAAGVPIEIRGAGQSSRQVNNFATPAAFETDKLIACEVITPASNWSSYPPHKHDEAGPTESELEEIYYYRFRSKRPLEASSTAAGGYQRVRGTPERPIDLLEEISDGDVVLIPHGWHGPAMAAPSHDMYYLNVMAGPGAERAWLITDDPEHAWIRDTWAGQVADPRLPFYPSVASTSVAPVGRAEGETSGRRPTGGSHG